MKYSIKGYIAPKASESFSDCADRYAYDKEQHRFAISDGVSRSFFPKIWAELLVSNWVKKQSSDSFLNDCQAEWLRRVTEIVEQPDIQWYTSNAFNRREAGLATFVYLEFYKKHSSWSWRAGALGDSFLFFVPTDVQSFQEVTYLSSKEEPIEFDNYPDYFSSIGNNHKGKFKKKEGSLSEGTFYLMTDALAEWFLKEKEKAISEISSWQSQKDFEEFISRERTSEKLGNDDSAILVIDILNTLEVFLEDVSCINDLISSEEAGEFSEKSPLASSITTQNQEDMSEGFPTTKNQSECKPSEEKDINLKRNGG